MNFLKAVVAVFLLTNAAFAANYKNKTAEDVALYCAAHGLRHIGGNPSYEGLGCASTPDAAYRCCCYGSRTDLITYDSAIVQARNGLWVACRRYVHKSQAGCIEEYRRKAGLPEKNRRWTADALENTLQK